MALRAVPKNEAKFGTPWKCVPTTLKRSQALFLTSCPIHREKLWGVINAFSFSLLVDRLRHFLVKSIAFPSLHESLVFRLDIGVSLLGEVLDCLLQTISFGTHVDDPSFHLLSR